MNKFEQVQVGVPRGRKVSLSLGGYPCGVGM